MELIIGVGMLSAAVSGLVSVFLARTFYKGAVEYMLKQQIKDMDEQHKHIDKVLDMIIDEQRKRGYFNP